MHCWRFLIPVLALLGSVASFVERSSIDGRERCVVRRQPIRAGPAQSILVPERAYTGKSSELDREHSSKRESFSHGDRISADRERRTNSIDRRTSREHHPSVVKHQSRILREARRNSYQDYRSTSRQIESYGSADAKNRVRLLRYSPGLERTLSTDRRDIERVEKRMRTDLRTDSRFSIRGNDGVLQRGNTHAFQTRLDRDSDSTRQISRRTRDTQDAERVRGIRAQDKERVSAERLIRHEEYRNSKEMTFRNNRQDIRSDRDVTTRETSRVPLSDENKTRRIRTRVTPEAIRDISARMNRGNQYSRQSRVSTRVTPENFRNTDEISISRQIRLNNARSNEEERRGDSGERRVRPRVIMGDYRNAPDTQNRIDQRTRISERLISRQSRIDESREGFREGRARTRMTPELTRQMSNRLDERIRNSKRRSAKITYSSERTVDSHGGRREIQERRTELAKAASESSTSRGYRFDGGAQKQVTSRARVSARSDQPLTSRPLSNSKHRLLERHVKSTRKSSQREPDSNGNADQSVRNSRLEQIHINDKNIPSPKNEFRFRRETAILESTVVPNDQPNKAHEYPEKHIGDAPMVPEWTTLIVYTLQGIYVCAVLHQMTSGKLNKNTVLGFYWRPSHTGKLIKSD